MVSKIICFFLGHRKNIKTQITQGYKMYICDRCNNVFAVHKEIEDAKAKKRIEKAQAKQKKKDEKAEKKLAKYEAKYKELNGEDSQEEDFED